MQCLWVVCGLLVLGSEGENTAMQTGLWFPDPMFDDGFVELMLHFSQCFDSQHLCVPEHILHLLCFLHMLFCDLRKICLWTCNSGELGQGKR